MGTELSVIRIEWKFAMCAQIMNPLSVGCISSLDFSSDGSFVAGASDRNGESVPFFSFCKFVVHAVPTTRLLVLALLRCLMLSIYCAGDRELLDGFGGP